MVGVRRIGYVPQKLDLERDLPLTTYFVPRPT
jgi:hypothetical protein